METDSVVLELSKRVDQQRKPPVISIDSRSVGKGDVFFALETDTAKATQHVEQAIERGALCIVASSAISTSIGEREEIIAVEDVLATFDSYAEHRRAQIPVKVAAITGSAGKTTVRGLTELWLATLAPEKVHASRSSFNNRLGVSVTLAGLHPTYQWLVAEVGTNAPGEIADLAQRIQPDVAVVLNATSAHLEGLGDIDGVVREKGSLYSSLASTGVAVIPVGQPHSDRWREFAAGAGKNVTFTTGDQPADVNVKQAAHNTFELTCPYGRDTVSCPLVGTAAASSIAAAAALVVALGENPLRAPNALAAFVGEPGRLKLHPRSDGKLIIDDTYNANPASIRNALSYLAEQTLPSIAVLGSMGELGDGSSQLHVETGSYARQLGIDELWAIGHEGQDYRVGYGGGRWFASPDELSSAVAELMQQSSEVAVLFKGSRFMKMEQYSKLCSEED